MPKTKVIEVVSSTKKVDNSANEKRKFNLSGSVNLNYGQLESISNGQVISEDKTIAYFEARENRVDVRNLSGTIEEKIEILTAIEEFVTDVKAEQTGVTL